MVGRLLSRRYTGLVPVLMLALALLATLFLVMVLPGIANAKKFPTPEPSPAPEPPPTPAVSAHGQGVSGQGEPFSFNVQAIDPASDAATGTFWITTPDGNGIVQGNLTCLRVATAPDGSGFATFAGPVTNTNLPDHNFGAFDVTDSGQPNGAGDLLNAHVAPSAACDTPGGTDPLQSGDVVVNTGT